MDGLWTLIAPQEWSDDWPKAVKMFADIKTGTSKVDRLNL
jgi:hypothetical protein